MDLPAWQEFLVVVGFVAAWVFVSRYLLPKLGVPT
jgi:hypothetical protein